MECQDPYVVENNIKKIFNEKFKLVAGREYFEGNEEIMKEEFLKMVNEYGKLCINVINIKKNNENSDVESNNHESSYNESSDVKEEFPNYKEDEEFGGNKQLIKMDLDSDDKLYINYIENKYSIGNLLIANFNVNDSHNDYYKKLIKNKIIENKKIYDFNNIKFLNNIKKYKKNINVYVSSEINNLSEFFTNKMKTKINKLITYLRHDMMINNNIFFNSFHYNMKQKSYITCAILDYPGPGSKIKDSIDYELNFDIVKINKIYYHYNFLRSTIPYNLYIGKNNFYVVNRNKENISQRIDDDYYETIRLFSDGLPWGSDEKQNNDNLKKIIDKYNRYTIGKKCIKMTENTKYILNIFNE